MKTALFAAIVLFLSGASAAPARAAFFPAATAAPGSVPGGMSYQGRLDDAGSPVTGTKSMTFTLFDAPAAGNQVWTSGAMNVSVSLGLFSTTLPIPVTALVGGGPRYLEVVVEGTTLSPREPFNAVPYALVAKTVEGTIDISTSGLSVTTGGGASLYISSNTGNVGVGTTGPAAKLHMSSGTLLIDGVPSQLKLESFGPNILVNATGAAAIPVIQFQEAGGNTAAIAYRNSGVLVNQNQLIVGTQQAAGKLLLQGGAGVTGLTVDTAGDAVVANGVKYPDGSRQTSAFVGVSTGITNTGDIIIASDNDADNNGSITFRVSGVDRIVVTTNGFVGIGNFSPNARLDVLGTYLKDAIIAKGASLSPGAAVSASAGFAGGGFLAGYETYGLKAIAGSASGGASPGTSYAVFAATSTGAASRVYAGYFGGNVGINEGHPQNALHITGFYPQTNFQATTGQNPGFRFLDPVATLLASAQHDVVSNEFRIGSESPGGQVVFRTDAAAEMMRISAAGNVGIGTALPAAKLHLSSGTALIDGAGATLAVSMAPTGIPTVQFQESGVTNAAIQYRNSGVFVNQNRLIIGTQNAAGTVRIQSGAAVDAVVLDTAGNVTVKTGGNTVFRCATAGALPVGALTVNAASCGTTADTGLRVP